MKLLIYSDLHLEFGAPFSVPDDAGAEVLILAGDIITFENYRLLDGLLQGWRKPVIFIAGNHEYYAQTPMIEREQAFAEWLDSNHPHVCFLRNESVSINGVHFFGGTMWTHFNAGDSLAMEIAQYRMSDFTMIKKEQGLSLSPRDTIELHKAYAAKLESWFAQELDGARVVISHHAPVTNPQTQYADSPLAPAFISLDMCDVIERYQPELWIYGHTHECDDQMMGQTRIVSNQRGYPNRRGGFECEGFDPFGLRLDIEPNTNRSAR